MPFYENATLLASLPFARRIAFVAFCAERCLGEVRRLRDASAQLPRLSPVMEGLALLWDVAAGEPAPDPERVAAVETKVGRAIKERSATAKLTIAARSAAGEVRRGLRFLQVPDDATGPKVASAVNGPGILAAKIYRDASEARNAEDTVLGGALMRLRDAKDPVSAATFDGLADWPRTPLAARYADRPIAPPIPAKTSEIVASLATASDEERAALVKKHGSKLAAHLPRIYMTDSADAVRHAARWVFSRIGPEGRRKIATALTAALSNASDEERARALDGIVILASTDAPAPPAKTLVELAASREPAVRAGALACAGRLAADDVNDAVRAAVAKAFTEGDAHVRYAALEALYHARRALEWAQRRDIPAFRALAGAAPEGGGRVASELLRGLVAFVREGTKREQEQALRVVIALGPDARPIALDLARAFGSAEHGEYLFGEALRRIGQLPDEVRPLLEAAATASAASARNADAVLQGAFGARVSLGQRIAQIEAALASSNRDDRISALIAATSLGRDAGAALPILLAHGAKVAAVDPMELSFTRDALRALGCPPDDLPHAPNRLHAFCGAVPYGEPHIEDGYAVATFSATRSDAPAGIALGSVGVWEDATGRLLFVVDGAEHLRILPGRAEAIAVRTTGPRGPGGAWYIERFALPAGNRLTSLEMRDNRVYGWVAGLDVVPKADALVAIVRVGDESGAARFRVALGRGTEPDTLVVGGAKKPPAKKARTKTNR